MKYFQNLKLARDIKTQHEGFSDWWKHRITGVFLIPLLFWIVGSFSLMAGFFDFAVNMGADASYASVEIKNWISQPYNTIIILLFFPIFFYHAYFGTKLVIEDYIQSTMLKNAAIIGMIFAYYLFAISGIFAVLKISLGY